MEVKKRGSNGRCRGEGLDVMKHRIERKEREWERELGGGALS